MDDRIGALHLHYHVGGGPGTGSALAPALTGGLDRALQAGLGEALGRKLAALAGDERSVIVVRELNAPLRLDLADCVLDSRVVDLFSQACAHAVTTLLAANPTSDTVMRFADQIAFAGAFVTALLDGSAWRHWYFGAFRRYRREDIGATVSALLQESGMPAGPLFGWLSRHGQLARLLTCLPAAQARVLLGLSAATPTDNAPGNDGNAVLVGAARRLLALLPHSPDDGSEERLDRFLASRPVGPDWRSSASLSAWMVQLLRFALRLPNGMGVTLPARDQAALNALLTGPLDWLDGAAIMRDLCTHSAAPPLPASARPRRQLLSPRQETILTRLAQRLRERSFILPAGADADSVMVHLLAAAAEHAETDDTDDTLGRSVTAVIALAVQAWREERIHADQDGAAQRANTLAALGAAGPSALALLAALGSLDDAVALPDDSGPLAGVLLLARAVSDLRLHALATHAGVPGTPLMAALATLWAGAPVPASPASLLWCGAGTPEAFDSVRSFEWDQYGAALSALRQALATLLSERRMLDASAVDALISDGAALASLLSCKAAPAIDLAGIANLLLRGWGYWLPGLAGSGPLFLLEKSIRRRGGVRVTPQCIAVELDPAPLDVVLKMAGYFAPLGPLPWLGGRRLVFTVRSKARPTLP
jgi:hypothetical protein